MQRRGRLSVKLAADYEDSKNSETQEQQSSRGDWFCESVEDCGEKSTEDHWFLLIVNMQQQTHYTKFVKQIKEKKDIVYDKDSIPGDAAPIHALCLQLLAKGIVKLNIENKSLIGTSNLEAKHIDVSLSTENVNGYPSLAILNNKNWEGINFYG